MPLCSGFTGHEKGLDLSSAMPAQLILPWAARNQVNTIVIHEVTNPNFPGGTLIPSQYLTVGTSNAIPYP